MSDQINVVCVVYLVTNGVNGRRYIGVTGRGIEKRLREHLNGAANGMHNGRFYRAIRKYGRSVFSVKALRVCHGRDEAMAAEIELIAALKPEYNSTRGGDGQFGRKMSDRTREALRTANTGKKYRLGAKLTAEQKAHLSEIGLKNREEWKRWSHLGPKAQARKVRCLDDGNTYESASSAAANYGVAKSALIELCLGRKYRKTVGGKRFEYVT